MSTNMETDCQNGNGGTSMAGGSVVVALHPLVIMNISEHWTRIRAQGKVVQGKVNDNFSNFENRL